VLLVSIGVPVVLLAAVDLVVLQLAPGQVFVGPMKTIARFDGDVAAGRARLTLSTGTFGLLEITAAERDSLDRSRAPGVASAARRNAWETCSPAASRS
jgi:hypothetical protein